ncbi:hypothetical protein [Halobellus rubicundus]|uniref:Uncharacterized protein n=1 Tax=Halobellus rubicundus TaxID=2996466 RepID=A0ABD5M9I3_9EURY
MSPTMEFDETDADETDAEAEPEHSHLDDLSDGAGCTEIWEHLSEGREE